MNNEIERELQWDDQIQESGPSFVLIPAGKYNFRVEKFERARHNGSTNLPSCPMALLTIKIEGGEHGETTVIHRLFLHSKTEGFLSNFFEAIGKKEEGQPIKMDWNAVTGAQGRCELEVNKYTNRDGEEKTNNQVKTFLPYADFVKNNNQGQQQATPTQQNIQQPFPTNNNQQNNQGQQQQNNQQGGFVQGQF